ncbi:hypothetical protein E2320_012791 [Naja naja]|nr:hypothetical protein E2320_012791 [Naja naja]
MPCHRLEWCVQMSQNFHSAFVGRRQCRKTMQWKTSTKSSIF